MLKILLFTAIVTGLLLWGLDHVEQQAYQAKAVQCLSDPERQGCTPFNTAAGPATPPTE